MRKSSVVVYGALALAGLVAAYLTWLQGEQSERPSEEITVFDCASRDLTSVELTTERKTVKIAVRREAGRDRPLYWVTSTTRPASSDGESRPAETQQFVGNDALGDYISRSLPLKALRSLGELPRGRLAELGLSRPTSRLELRCGNRRATYRLGGTTFGSEDRYARASSGGPVLLFAAPLARDLEAADYRFMQRELHRFQEADLDEARVTAFGRTKTLVQLNRRNPREAQWVDSGERARRNEIYGNWLDRVRGLRAREYLAPGAQPGGAAGRATRILEIVYTADGRQLDRMELVRVESTPQEYYARSETTRSWVEVPRSSAAEVEQDVRPVLGLDPLPAPPAADAGPPGRDAGRPDGGAAPAPRTLGDTGPRATADAGAP